MTISTSSSKIVCLGNGATVVFSFGFLIPQAGEEQITFTDANGVQTVLNNTQYMLVGFGNANGGTVTYPLGGSPTPIPTGTSLTIARVLPLVQGTTISNQGAFYPQVVEGALDYEMMVSQQIQQEINQTVRGPIVDQNPIGQLPAAAQRAGKYFAFDNSGNPLMVAGAGPATNLVINGSSSGQVILNAQPTASGVIVLPNGNDTLIARGSTDAITGPKTFAANSLILAGSTSGTTLLNATAIASGTITVPVGNDTLVGRNTTDALTNKSMDGASNTFTNLPLGSVTGTLGISHGGTSATDVGTARLNFTVPVYVSTISALAALDTTKDTTAILTASGRGGTFVFSSANLSTQVTNDPQQGVYVAPASAPTGASGAWVRQYLRLSAEYFGASTSATASANFTAIQAAINFAQNYDGYLYYPKLYSINGTLTWSNNVVMEGVSAFTSGITTTTGAAISWVPSTLIANNNTWYGLYHMSVISTDVGAHYGIEYASTGSEYLSNFEIVGCYLSGTSGGASFDSTGSSNGIFSCTIRRNWFNNGLVIKDGGDSITFTENTVNGNGIGLLVNGLKTGARQLTIRNNNFSALSECVYLLNVTGAFVDSNWMETPSYLGSYTGTTGSLMYAQACSNIQITRNTIQPLASVGGGFVPAAYSIRLNTSGSFNIISANQLIAIGGTGHIQIGGGVTNTYIDWNNNFDVTAVITDAGTGTFGAGSSPGIFKQLVSFQTATQFTSVIQALCTDTGTGNGPYYELYRNKAGGAAVNDGIGGFLWYGNNGSATKTNLGYLTMTWTNVTAGSESGTFNIATYNAGSLTLAMTLGSTIALNRAATFSSYAAPLTNGGAALGQATLGWSNAFFSSGAAINFANGNATITHGTLGRVVLSGSLGRGAPVTKTGNFSLADTENWIIVNQAATTTVTLPAASSYSGREVTFKTIQAQTLVSASSNVVPLAGGAAGTAILAATAGKWATLVSDGTNWQIMAGA